MTFPHSHVSNPILESSVCHSKCNTEGSHQVSTQRRTAKTGRKGFPKRRQSSDLGKLRKVLEPQEEPTWGYEHNRDKVNLSRERMNPKYRRYTKQVTENRKAGSPHLHFWMTLGPWNCIRDDKHLYKKKKQQNKPFHTLSVTHHKNLLKAVDLPKRWNSPSIVSAFYPALSRKL